MANLFNISLDYLLSNSDNPSKKKGQARKIPVVGYVTAGIPFDAIEEIIDWEDIPEEMAKKGEYFVLKIKGHSMEPRICEGDVVIIKRQDDVDSGSIAVVTVNGDEGTCKKIHKNNFGLTLISLNPAFDPIFFPWEQVEALPVKVIGKAVEIRGKLL